MKETEKENQENTFEEALQKLERAVEKLDEGLSLIHISSPRDKRQSRMPSSA